MASGVISLTSNHSRLAAQIVWESSSNGSTANSSYVTAYLQVRKTDTYTTYGNWTGTLNVNGTSESFTVYEYVNSSWVTIKTISGVLVSHNSDGTAGCYIYGVAYGPAGTTLEGYRAEGDSTVTLDTIPRYANFTEHYVKSVGLNSITVKWNADAGIDYVQYSLNGGAWVGTAGLEYTIGGLNPNTSYNIRTAICRTDSGLWTYSDYIYATTQDIARMSVSDFEHGNNASVVITNPSRWYFSFGNECWWCSNINKKCC